MTEEEPRPLLRVVRGGDPTAEELAALTVAVAALQAQSTTEPERTPRSRWAAKERQLRRALRPGPDAWRWSLRSG